VHRWEPDPQRGRFRDWLFRIARNAIINRLTRPGHKPLGSGSSGVMKMLYDHCDEASGVASLFDLEHRRAVFQWAASRVRKSVNETTWQAFWRTSVESRPVTATARALGVSVGSIYVARSRVMAKLRDEVTRYDDRSHDTTPVFSEELQP
jgi:RNA polymerase sigma-70 factor (ECF subfamily)